MRVDRDEKQLILDADPEVYFTSPHYNGYPAVQIRLAAISRDELRDRLEDAWLIQAPKRLAADYTRARSVSDWDTVRELAAGLPGVDESTSYGQPALKVKGKLFAWMSPNREAPGALALRVDPDEKQPILEAGHGVYFTVPHYDGLPDRARAPRPHRGDRAARADRGRVAAARAIAPGRGAPRAARTTDDYRVASATKAAIAFVNACRLDSHA